MSTSKNSIARRLFLTILIFSFIVTFVTTIFQALLDYRKTVAQFDQEVRRIEGGMVSAIASSVWNYDLDHLQVEAEGLARLPIIQSVRIELAEGRSVEAGKPLAQSEIRRELPLTFTHEGREIPTGKLIVGTNRATILDSVLRNILPIFLFQALSVSIICLLLFGLFEHDVTRHLQVIADFCRHLGIARLDIPLVLRRRHSADDEIEAVASAINGMCRSLYSSYEEINSAQESLRESEYHLRLITDGVPSHIVHLSADLRILFANAAYARFRGLRQESLVGRPLREVLPRELFTAAEGYIGHVLSGETVSYERRETDASGTDHIMSVTYVPRWSPSGNVSSLLGIIHDITDYKRMEEELKTAKEAAETASRHKSLFLANVSHEIRTPIHGIMGILSLLIGSRIDQRQRELLGDAYGCADSLLTIVNDILDFSKIEANRMEICREPFLLRPLLTSLAGIFEVLAAEKSVRMTVQVAEDLPDKFIGDGARLRQVLTNLLSNAVKFTNSGEIFLEVSALPAPAGADGKQLRFTVRDTGIGIDPSKIESLFSMFTQGDSSSTKRFGGTGLGLAITRSLCELMGGTIRVDSVVGKGSIFEVVLPLEETADGTETAHPPLAEAPVQAGLASLRVLLAEDNAISRKIAIEFLEAIGQQVTAVKNGRELVEAATLAEFDLIITDISMPEMDGLDAARAIRALPDGNPNRAIPTIAMTAHAITGERERFLEAGMNGYIAKPFRLSELEGVIREVQRRAAPPAPEERPEPAETATDTIDLGYLRENFGAKPDFYLKLLRQFREEMPERLADIRDRIAGGDLKRAGEAAHALKGEAGLLGALAAMLHAETVHRQCREGSREQAEETMRALERSVAEFFACADAPGFRASIARAGS